MSGFDFSTVLGNEVKGKEGKVNSSEIGNGKKYVAFYYSAHWCPPCRGFTPTLVEYYKNHKDEMEIVFISSDRDEAAFNEYYDTMDWLALPFSEREKKEALSNKHGIRGIPTLVILHAESGKVLVANGRGDVGNGKFGWGEDQQQSKE